MAQTIDTPQEIIFQAARLFRTKGYPATSIRDIGEALGVSSSALYYHFKNKDEVLCEVMRYGVRVVHQAVREAIDRETDPWNRMRAGLRAHIVESLNRQDFEVVLLQETRYLKPETHQRVLDERDAYEGLWRRMFEEGRAAGLFKPAVNLHLFRLLIFGSMNWVVIWYKPEGTATPETIADALLEYMGQGVFWAGEL
jgi:AcrR family transcriptional regulator